MKKARSQHASGGNQYNPAIVCIIYSLLFFKKNGNDWTPHGKLEISCMADWSRIQKQTQDTVDYSRERSQTKTPFFLLYWVSLIPSLTFTSNDYGEKSICFKFSLIPNFSMQKSKKARSSNTCAVQLASEFSVIDAKLRDSHGMLTWLIHKIQNASLMSPSRCHRVQIDDSAPRYLRIKWIKATFLKWVEC